MSMQESNSIDRRLATLGFMGLAFLAEPVYGQSADLPVTIEGTQWKLAVYYATPTATPNRTWLITSVTATGIESTENGEPLRLTHELNVVESPRTRESNPRLLSFPLAVGKKWQYVSDWVFKPKGASGKATVDVAVIGYEKVRVAAGEFDAFKLTSRERLSGTSPIGSQYAGETTRTYWYAPAAQAIVKSVSRAPPDRRYVTSLSPSTVAMGRGALSLA